MGSSKRQSLVNEKGLLNNQSCSGLKRLPREEVSSVPLPVFGESGECGPNRELQTGFWTLSPTWREYAWRNAPPGLEVMWSFYIRALLVLGEDSVASERVTTRAPL